MGADCRNQLMPPRRFFSLTLSFILFLPLPPTITASVGERCTANSTALDALIRNRAFLPFPSHRTGRPYHVQLPRNLSAVTARALRLRGGDLWLRGASLGSFRLPPGIFTRPYARRTLVIFYDLGNLSDSYFAVSGHVLASPVVACLAYDASNATFAGPEASIRELSLQPTRGPMTITFPAAFKRPVSAAARCVRFGSDGSAHVGTAVMEGMRCLAMGTGHYSVVVPVEVRESSKPQPDAAEKKGRGRWVWVAVGAGVVGVGLLVVVVGMAVRRVGRKSRMVEMARKADEGEALDSVWVRGSKMPAAAVARTQPAIENEIFT